MQAIQSIQSGVGFMPFVAANLKNAKVKTLDMLSLLSLQQAHQVMETIKPLAKGVFKYYSLYSMYEAAFSDVFCLQTYRHGTDPYARARIALFGPNLDKAGKGGEAKYYEALGQTSPWAARDRQRKAFYVVRQRCEGVGPLDVMHNYVENKLTAKYYSLRSTMTFFASFLPLPMTWKANIITDMVQRLESHTEIKFFSFLAPTVKFHFEYWATQRWFYDDDKGAGKDAVYTCKQFSAFDSGISGILKNGLNRDLFTRISENKNQFLWGVAQLVIAVAFTAFCFPHLIPGGDLIVAGAMKVYHFRVRWGQLGDIVIAPLSIPFVYAALQW